MATPNTRRVLRKESAGVVQFQEEPIPEYGTSDVLIRVRAVSLNWKDAAIVDGRTSWAALPNGIVGTEFAGEVVQVGGSVRFFKTGDRVMSLINYDDITGNETTIQALGHNIDGTLAEYLVVPEIVLVKIPEYLTWAEASTIPCAGLTAWSALNFTSRLAGKTVLLEGTGGVSLLALLLAVKAGAKVIITSSSDEKLQRAKELGATHTINYVKVPDWDQEVLKLTGGLGAHIVVEAGGAATFLKSVASVKRGGQVSQVGLMTTNSNGNFVDLIPMLIMKAVRIVGIRVGLKADLEDFAAFLEATQLPLSPCIDKVYKFDQSKEALDYLRSSSLFGKVIIEF
ncbi:Zinc-type alcohol dehydrogenase-like protein [Cladobotryum mycophilum]|uniref:Zinc-type alcohol dehydrogenase-like protein n=1 Tax=Cladobotryum mycophilum TaxID=491253 RepID=A0ABR0T592_9HYPO